MDMTRPYRLNVLCYVYAGISSILPIRHVESRGGGYLYPIPLIYENE